jgi:hypothetical protein
MRADSPKLIFNHVSCRNRTLWASLVGALAEVGILQYFNTSIIHIRTRDYLGSWTWTREAVMKKWHDCQEHFTGGLGLSVEWLSKEAFAVDRGRLPLPTNPGHMHV